MAAGFLFTIEYFLSTFHLLPVEISLKMASESLLRFNGLLGTRRPFLCVSWNLWPGRLLCWLETYDR